MGDRVVCFGGICKLPIYTTISTLTKSRWRNGPNFHCDNARALRWLGFPIIISIGPRQNGDERKLKMMTSLGRLLEDCVQKPRHWLVSLLVSLSVCNDLISIPLIAFDLEAKSPFWFELTVLVFWTLDILMSALTGYMAGGEVDVHQLLQPDIGLSFIVIVTWTIWLRFACLFAAPCQAICFTPTHVSRHNIVQ